MRIRRAIGMAAAVAVLPVAVWLGAQAVAPRKAFAEILPANALLCVEAKNLGSLLADWNASAEKKTWLGSGTYQSYVRSKLALRLEELQKAYADGIGVNPNALLLENIAGGESAVAVYDIGKLEILYATRLPAARLADNLLMQGKSKFQARNAGGQTYYVKSTGDGTVAFAVAAGDLLIAGTREDLVAGSLQLLAGQQGRLAMKGERWYSAATGAAAPGVPDLRLVVNLERTVRTPHFRSYWIQQNITDLKQYVASVSDLTFTQGEWTERRVLLRAEAAAGPVDEAGVGQLARVVPADAGFYQAWAKPERTEVEALLQAMVVPRAVRGAAVNPLEERAPGESSYETAGSEQDLDQRVDVEEPGLPSDAGGSALPVATLAAARVEAIAKVGASRMAADGVFVGVDSALLLLGSKNWDENAVKNAVLASAQQAWTTGTLTWNRRGAAVWELSGLAPMQVWIDGKVLLLANSAALADRVAAKRGGVTASGASIAGYRHGAENANYARMMRLIDTPQIPTGDARAPMLFSENLAGIGRILGRVDSVSMETKDDGAMVRQVVVYRRRPS